MSPIDIVILVLAVLAVGTLIYKKARVWKVFLRRQFFSHKFANFFRFVLVFRFESGRF